MTKKLSENIQNWVDALRSGEYTQQEGTLKGPNGYCCLGVYCSNEPPKLYSGHQGPDELYDFCRDHIKEDVVDNGIQMNDAGRSFLDIADMIEEEYLKEDS